MIALSRRPALLAHARAGAFILLLAVVGGGLVSAQGVPDSIDPDTDAIIAVLLSAQPHSLAGAALMLHLPTSNDALFRGDEAGFYQRLDKERVPGLRRSGWEGGRYGFVRNEARTPAGPVFTRLHQGVDIRPVYRNREGLPLDTIRAIADGRVVYANRVEARSSYGLYVVVRHEWDGSEVYSLLAHLRSIWVSPGDLVRAGDALGLMGYTGRGLNRERAHVHLEIGLLLNRNYQAWHDSFYRGLNWHGAFNGLNLRGIDAAGLYLALQEDPTLTFAEFVRGKRMAYQVALPGDRPLDILERYPWLAVQGVSAADAGGPGAWLIGFSREGVPVEISRRPTGVREPQVVWVADDVRRRHLSLGSGVARTGTGYQLTRTGRGLAALLATTPGSVPEWF
jgi:murein DD-endopeptidase MepM/ murein hydrolase activator NlpD